MKDQPPVKPALFLRVLAFWCPRRPIVFRAIALVFSIPCRTIGHVPNFLYQVPMVWAFDHQHARLASSVEAVADAIARPIRWCWEWWVAFNAYADIAERRRAQ